MIMNFNKKGGFTTFFFINTLDFLKKYSILWYIHFHMNTKIKINGNKTINHNNIKAKLGITDKSNHSVFYMEGGAFITPRIELDNFIDTMEYIEKTCRKQIQTKLRNNSFLDNTFLMNFEICSDRMKKDKNSYLSFQYHFKQKDDNNDSIVTIKKNNEDFFIDLLDELEGILNEFQMNVRKKRKEA